MLRPALLALSVVAFATACATDSLTAPEAAPVTMLAMTADASASAVIERGQTALLTSVLQHANERAVGRRVRWASSNDDVASVNPNGLVSAHAEGEATITATSNQGSEQLRIIVREPGAEPAPSDTTSPTPAPGDSTPQQPAPGDSTPQQPAPTDSTPQQPAPTDSVAPPPPQQPEPAPPVMQPAPSPGTAGTGAAQLPRRFVDVTMPAVTGRSINVPAGGDIQAALDAAQPGDEIVLQAGATYVGHLTLRNKGATSAWITIRGNGSLPAPGTRVTPSQAGQMPKLIGQYAAAPIIMTEPGANHYRLIGLEITGAPGQTWTYTLVALGDDSHASIDRQPHHIVLDRMYVHGLPDMHFQRCIALNTAETAVVDSWVSDCHGKNMDSQAIAGWNGTGPFKIVNNFIEGAGENLMFGGSTPSISGLVPSDIEIRRNHFYKPTSWKGVWTVKNLLELKNAQRLLVEGNIFENNWADGQVGYALVWKSSTGNDAPWTVVQDLTFRYNIVRNSPAALSLSARPEGPAQPARRIHLEHNVFSNIGDFGGVAIGRMLTLTDDLEDISIVSNTFVHSAYATHLLVMDGSQGRNLTFSRNIATRGSYGVFGSGAGEGTSSFNTYWGSNWSMEGNVLVGDAPLHLYPAGNKAVASLDLVGFVNSLGGDFRLAGGSTATGAGADASAVSALTSGVAQR